MTAFLLDMDGILYHGSKVLPGAREFIARVSSHKHLFITNNPVKPPRLVAERLSRMGFGVIPATRIVTSAEATALWLGQQQPRFSYYAIGGEGLHEALSRVGKADSQQADFVVIGEGPGLDYNTLATGINLILSHGARLVSTNPDVTVDSWQNGKHQYAPGGGALTAPFEVATGEKAIVIGKPGKLLYQMAIQRMKVSAAECIMIGDRPDTDIAGAAALGIRSALVRSGCFAPGAPWPDGVPRPDWDVNSLDDLLSAFMAAGVLS